jgi:hypothetical protein
MKQKLLSAVMIGLGLSAVSCVSLDEKLITGISSQYYSTPDGLSAAVTASYSQLRNYYGREQMIKLALAGTDTWQAGDQATTDGVGSQQDFDKYNGNVVSSAASLANTWNPAYQMINTLNSALDRGPNTSGIPAATKATLLGEAHFLRALEYFTLVKTFGDVSLILHEQEGVVASATRDPASDVYKSIIADLDTAVSSLPVTTPDYGRATKGAALTLRSMVYLTRAYKQPAFGGTATADFTQAHTDAMAVINSGTYTLEPFYRNLFCVDRAGDPGHGGYCENTGYVENHKEFIFTVQFQAPLANNDADNEYNYLHLVFLGQYDNTAASVGIPRDINNGRPFRRMMPTQYNLASIWTNRFFGTPLVPGPSDVLDERFDGSYQTMWLATAGGSKNPAGVCPNCTNNAVVNVNDTTNFMPATYLVSDAFRASKSYMTRTLCPAGFADPTVACPQMNQNETTNGYYNWQRYPSLKKFQDNRRGAIADQNSGKTQVIYRLAEVYLIAAEADLNLGNPAEAVTHINVIRTRAASPAHKADNNITVAQLTGLKEVTTAGVAPGMDFLMQERERELSGEFTRWYDLTRVSAQYFVDRVQKFSPNGRALVKTYHALRPIPQTQIDGVVVGAKYPQNPGYP